MANPKPGMQPTSDGSEASAGDAAQEEGAAQGDGGAEALQGAGDPGSAGESAAGSDESAAASDESAAGSDESASAGDAEGAGAERAEEPHRAGGPRAPASVVGAAWASPLVRLERGWTWLESRLLFGVLITLVVSLCVWVSFNGLSSPLTTDNSAGTIFRALVGGAVLGGIVQLSMRGRPIGELGKGAITTLAVFVGFGVAPLWRGVGVDYFGAALNWLQEGSVLMLLGGLHGVAARLTILAALLGASLAAASGKHINIDVVVRFMRPWMRMPVYLTGAVATAAVCFIASWGFFDYISIEGFGLEKGAPASAKMAEVRREVGEHFFLARKQIGLDLSTIPVVLRGGRWDDPTRMNGAQWNAWVEGAGFRDHYTREQVDALLADNASLDQPRVVAVVVPGGSARGLLVHDLNLMFPFGLFMMGLRVLLRALLALSGRVSIEPAGHEPGEEIDEPTDAGEVA